MINFPAVVGVSRLIVLVLATKLSRMAKRRGVRQLPDGAAGDRRSVRVRASLLDALVKRVAADHKVVDALAMDLLLIKVAPLFGLEREAAEALKKDGLTTEDLMRLFTVDGQDELPLEVPMAS